MASSIAPHNGRWILAATIIGASMAFIDSSVVNVALPELQEALDATAIDVQWVVESYILFLAALILVGGSMGDRYGRRRIYAIGIGVFAAASMLCGLAPTVDMLIFGRALQGIGGAMLVPGSLAIIRASFNDEERGRAIGTWSGFSAITSAIGPVIGGWLIDSFSWRWIFYINLPLAIVVLLILFWRVPESRDEMAPHTLDWWGALSITVGLGGLVYALIESGHGGWYPQTTVALILGIVGIIVFVVVESRAATPMLPLHLFRSPTFSGANLLTLLLYSALGSTLFFLPFNLIQVQGYSATAAGAVFLPLILIMSVLARWAGGLVDRVGARPPLIAGPTIAAVGFALFAVPGKGGNYWTTFFPAVIILGIGMSICVAPLTTAVLGAVDARYAGVASAVNNAMSRLAFLLAIAALGIVMLSSFNRNLDVQLAPLEIPAAAQQQLDEERIKLAGAEVPAELSAELSTAVEEAIDNAFIRSFRIVMLINAALAAVSVIFAVLMIEGKQARRPQA